MNPIRRMRAALEDHRAGRLTDPELHSVTLDAMVEFTEAAALSGSTRASEPTPAPSATPTVTISSDWLADLQRRAAAAPALIEAARQAQAHPVTVDAAVAAFNGRGPAAASLSAPPPSTSQSPEPTEADWDHFAWTLGPWFGGRPKERPLEVIDPLYPGGRRPEGAVLASQNVTEAVWDGYISDMGLGSNPYGRYTR